MSFKKIILPFMFPVLGFAHSFSFEKKNNHNWFIFHENKRALAEMDSQQTHQDAIHADENTYRWEHAYVSCKDNQQCLKLTFRNLEEKFVFLENDKSNMDVFINDIFQGSISLGTFLLKNKLSAHWIDSQGKVLHAGLLKKVSKKNYVWNDDLTDEISPLQKNFLPFLTFYLVEHKFLEKYLFCVNDFLPVSLSNVISAVSVAGISSIYFILKRKNERQKSEESLNQDKKESEQAGDKLNAADSSEQANKATEKPQSGLEQLSGLSQNTKAQRGRKQNSANIEESELNSSTLEDPYKDKIDEHQKSAIHNSHSNDTNNSLANKSPGSSVTAPSTPDNAPTNRANPNQTITADSTNSARRVRKDLRSDIDEAAQGENQHFKLLANIPNSQASKVTKFINDLVKAIEKSDFNSINKKLNDSLIEEVFFCLENYRLIFLSMILVRTFVTQLEKQKNFNQFESIYNFLIANWPKELVEDFIVVSGLKLKNNPKILKIFPSNDRGGRGNFFKIPAKEKGFNFSSLEEVEKENLIKFIHDIRKYFIEQIKIDDVTLKEELLKEFNTNDSFMSLCFKIFFETGANIIVNLELDNQERYFSQAIKERKK